MAMKKAQAASPQSYVSLLIFIIGLVLVLYIMMLPPADRADLLEQNRTTSGDGDKDQITVLLNKEPGTLSDVADTEIIDDIPSFNLYSRTDATVITTFESIYVQKSLFEEQSRNISFSIDDFSNTDNFVLSFSTMKSEGRLTITLNGQILFSDEIINSPGPIRLPKDMLKPNNNIVFEVSGPGAMFWETNEYQLRDVKITADYTDTSKQENKHFIFISEEEMENLESFELSFVVDCKATEVGNLEIYLNKRLIYSAVPDCGYKIKVPEVDAKRLRQGENDILFMTDEGNFLFYGIETRLNLKEPLFPTYYFTIDQETYDFIKDDRADINVTMLFTNEDVLKKGFLYVNEYKIGIDTYDLEINRKINSYVRKGNNAIEIVPQDDLLHILELQVLVAE